MSKIQADRTIHQIIFTLDIFIKLFFNVLLFLFYCTHKYIHCTELSSQEKTAILEGYKRNRLCVILRYSPSLNILKWVRKTTENLRLHSQFPSEIFAKDNHPLKYERRMLTIVFSYLMFLCGIVTRLWAGQPWNWGSIPGRVKVFSFSS
jgi:hypothetical protein